MWKKKALAILTAAAMAGSAIQPVMAQNYGRDYGNGYQNGYNDPYGNNGYDKNRYYSDRDRYDQQRDPYERDRYNYDRSRAARFDRAAYLRECERQKSGNTAGGAIVGAIAGGLLGNAISRGPQRGAGTAVGAILGGVVGGTIGNNSLNCEDRSYEIDTYYSGFEAGRPHARYDWRSPRSDAYGIRLAEGQSSELKVTKRTGRHRCDSLAGRVLNGYLSISETLAIGSQEPSMNRSTVRRRTDGNCSVHSDRPDAAVVEPEVLDPQR